MGFSENELLEAVDATFDPINESLGNDANMYVAPDPFAETIHVYVDGGTEVPDEVVEGLNIEPSEEPARASVDPLYNREPTKAQENANTVAVIAEEVISEEVAAEPDNRVVEAFDIDINVEPMGEIEKFTTYRG